jgi:hypothetical protein
VGCILKHLFHIALYDLYWKKISMIFERETTCAWNARIFFSHFHTFTIVICESKYLTVSVMIFIWGSIEISHDSFIAFMCTYCSQCMHSNYTPELRRQILSSFSVTNSIKIWPIIFPPCHRFHLSTEKICQDIFRFDSMKSVIDKKKYINRCPVFDYLWQIATLLYTSKQL